MKKEVSNACTEEMFTFFNKRKNRIREIIYRVRRVH